MSSCIICHNNVRKYICLQTLTNDLSECDCNPIIHKKCFNKWKKISNSCPICRKKYVQKNIINETNEINRYAQHPFELQYEYDFVYTNTILLACGIIIVDVLLIGKFFFCIMYYKLILA